MPQITKSIGTAARDYATITLWEADLDNALVYAIGDTALGECYNDSAFDESFVIDGGGVIGLTGITLSVAVGQRHTGIAGTGARIVRTVGAASIISMNPPASCPLIIQWLEVNGNNQSFTAVINGNGANNGRAMTLRNMIIHDSNFTGAGSAAGINGPTRDIRVMNNFVYDILHSGSTAGGMIGILLDSDLSVGGCLNNTVYFVRGSAVTGGAIIGISIVTDDVDARVRNNISMATTALGAGGYFDFTFPGSALLTSSNNMSSDDTADDGGGAGNLINQVTANQFVSIVNGSEDLHLKNGSAAINTGVDLGTTPTGVQFDIDNFDRDTSGVVWDIGADEFTGVALGGTLPFMGVG